MNTNTSPISLDLFPGMVFEYMPRPPPGQSKCCGTWEYCGSCRACDVCGTTVRGSVYHCRKTSYDVHPRCADLQMKIKVERTEFELRKGGHSKCDWCKKKRLRGCVDNVPGYSYVSRDGKNRFHVYCLMDMGLEHRSSSLEMSCREVALPEMRLVKKPSCDWERAVKRLGKAVGLFLKIVLSVLFGDPTMILTSVVVHLLKP